MRTFARDDPLYTVTIISSRCSELSGVSSTGVFSMYAPSAAFASSLICEITSSPALSSPPSAPAHTAAAMPRLPPVLGTTTLLTFLMMLPLASTAIRSGVAPSAARATAAQ